MATWGQFDCITPAREPCGGAETGTNISSNHLVNLTPPLQEGHNESSSAIKPTLNEIFTYCQATYTTSEKITK